MFLMGLGKSAVGQFFDLPEAFILKNFADHETE